ncbi:putative siderophore-binding lipoprotein YfiY [Paenibacillus solanacearum]|uniref:Siderophore-binding lipoprotein YfiY n=1 Tax=Paenibacillus solanacearum TaxID=2048548 RepID=A0A916NNU4_9BACL|nr:ABC transporter substrate-binding protein [Paenibacillus solanacearum]CAG7610383.1 putative siderophore-binding lipoprotein YfiY [Paenibacillus solanacearum]
MIALVQRAVAAALLLTMLTACGSGSSDTVGGQAAAGGNDTPLNSQQKQAEAERGAKQTRTVKDEFSQVEIPARPKRVAGIYVEDYLKALGVTPVVQWYHPTWGKQDYLKLDVPQFDITGSLEALIAQDLDLIIVDGSVDQAKYEQYSKIAPTYRLPEPILQSSEAILRTIADVLGIPEKADSVLASYNAKVNDAKAKFQKTVGKQTVAVIRVNTGDKTIALFGATNRYTGQIYSEFGLEPHPLVRTMKAFQEILSEEAFPSLDADHIIVLPSNGGWDSKENQEAFKLLDSPLWKSVPAFKNGHVYKVDRTFWQSGAITANMMKLDDLFRLLARSIPSR